MKVPLAIEGQYFTIAPYVGGGGNIVQPTITFNFIKKEVVIWSYEDKAGPISDEGTGLGSHSDKPPRDMIHVKGKPPVSPGTLDENLKTTFMSSRREWYVVCRAAKSMEVA